MKLAIITSGYLPVVDGVTICTRERLKRLSEWGHEVLLIAPCYEGAAAYYPDWRDHTGNIFPGVHVASMPSAPLPGIDWERNPTRAAQPFIDRLLTEFRPDAIHVDEPERLAAGLLCRAGKAYAKRAKTPLVAFYHTNFVDYAPDYFPSFPVPVISLIQWVAARTIAAVYNGYDRTLVPSESSRRKVKRFGIRNARVGNFHGVDTKRFGPKLRVAHYFAREWALPRVDGRFVLLFVSRFTPDKGWACNTRMLPRLAEKLRDRLAVVVAGDGDMRVQVEKACEGRIPSAHFLGRVHPDRIPGLMANATLHVTASEKESFGLTVLEAFASGTPVVGPHAAGIGELVQDMINGRLYPQGDEQALERILLELAADPGGLEKLRTGALMSAQARDWDVTTQNWLDAINSVSAEIETLE
jgi:glycosyltransferase involved in cell wall biosynthesis